MRTVRHWDPGTGLVRCRLVAETSRMLDTMGLTRITMILSAPQGVAAGPVRGGGVARGQGPRLRAVPALED